MFCIENKGEITLESLTLLGATNKDETKIGYFGSGNKYAIACLLRNNVAFKIFSGEKELVVTTREIDFRGIPYKQILIDGKDTSLTTRMGPNWEIWFAVREFVCNAMDEEEYQYFETEDCRPRAGYTRIFVDKEPILDFVENTEKYITTRKEAIWLNPGKDFNVYRRGISVVGKNDMSSLFHYNFTDLDINESRTFSNLYEVTRQMGHRIARTEDPAIILRYIHNWESDVLEKSIQWAYIWSSFSDTWKQVLKDTLVCPKALLQFQPPEDRSFYTVLPDELCNKLPDGIRILGRDTMFDFQEMTIEEPEVIKQALIYVSKILMVPEKIKFGVFNNKSVVAVCSAKEISFSVEFLDRDMTFIVSTLIEEILHTYGYRDGSREFEQKIMELLAQELIECTAIN